MIGNNEYAGRYIVADDDFDGKVISIAETLADEVRRVRLVAAHWPIKVAATLLKGLPKLKPAATLVQDCHTVLFANWRAPVKMNSERWVLNLLNGLLDLNTQTLSAHSPGHYSSLQLPFAYAPAADCPAWDEYLASAVPDAEARLVLQEWCGYCLIPSTHHEMALFLLGPGGTGKSTFIKMLRKLVGEDQCSTVALESLGDKFQVNQMRDKLLNVVTEVDTQRAINDVRFKAYVSGDPVTGEKKYGDPHSFTPFARFVVGANMMPKVLDTTDAFYRRLILVNFNQRFVSEPNPDAEQPEMKRDPQLHDKLVAELPGILNWALEGLKRLNRRGHFDIPDQLQANVASFRVAQDNALRFITEQCVMDSAFTVSTTDLYRAYVAWCKNEGEKHYANNRFGQVVANYPGVQAKKNGHKGRFYKGLRPADAAAVDAKVGDSAGGGAGSAADS